MERGIPARLYEEYAYVLDYLQFGRPGTDKPRHLALPTVQVIGETYFTLLETEIRSGAQVNLHERVYIGKDRREKINRIIGRIGYNDLTANAKAELLPVLEDLIAHQEERFVSFFNNSQAITPRMHALELLPGIGKKSMWQIINEREETILILPGHSRTNKPRRPNQSASKANSRRVDRWRKVSDLLESNVVSMTTA